jgi:nitrogen fixation/metabolism regulation signal transduction histidine kinase
MTDLDPDALSGLLDDVRRELGSAVDELERSRAAHRQAESLLLAVLDHVPTPLVVVDRDQRVRAASAAAEGVWGSRVDAPLGAVEVLRDAGLDETCRVAVAEGHLARDAVPDGFGVAVLDEPGTGARFVVLWSSSAAGPAG